MKLHCLNCLNEFEGSISLDELGWHSVCPECGSSFDVDVPDGKIIMAFVDDRDPDLDWVHFADGWMAQDIRTYYAFNDVDSFIDKWKVMVERPDGMWYWLLNNGELFCSGACDPDDIEIFEEYFDRKF